MANKPWKILCLSLIAVFAVLGNLPAEENPYRGASANTTSTNTITTQQEHSKRPSYAQQQSSQQHTSQQHTSQQHTSQQHTSQQHTSQQPRRLEHRESSITPIQNSQTTGNIKIELSENKQEKSLASKNSKSFFVPTAASQQKLTPQKNTVPANSKAALPNPNAPYDKQATTAKKITESPLLRTNFQKQKENTAKVLAPASDPKENIAAVKEMAPMTPKGPKKPFSGIPSPWSSLTGVLSSLAVVIGLFFIVMWVARKGGKVGSSQLPQEVFEILGRAPAAPKQQLQLLRLGNKLVLVSVTPAGMETLTEVTDAQEVDRLCGLCVQSKSGSSSKSFRQILKQFGSEPAANSFVDNEKTPSDKGRRTTNA